MDDQKVYFAKGLIADNFESVDKIECFIDQIDNCYSYETLLNLMTVLYRGYGTIPVDESIIKSCQLKLCSDLEELRERNVNRILQEQVNIFKRANSPPVISRS